MKKITVTESQRDTLKDYNQDTDKTEALHL